MDRERDIHDTVTLPVGCTAKYDTCGSCKFFKRRDFGKIENRGWCNIALPPFKFRMVIQQPKESNGDGWGENSMFDTQRCDFYKNDHKHYIEQHAVMWPGPTR